ncbi:MAG: polyprenyl synthetase family protein [Burkholderiaceae bacterium]
MRAMRARVEAALDRALPPSTIVPERLHEAMRYATLGGGKRVRAMLVYAAADWATERAQVSGAASLAAFPLDAADAAAVAVELIHAYSLVHDDLPCMDDDVLRRGRPTVHVAFDEATALLVGDALQSLAFERVATAAPDGARGAEQVILLAVASGSRGMAGGQAIDLESVGEQLAWTELEAMHRAKTGALLRAAVLLGVGTTRTLHGTLGGVPDDRQRAALDDFCAAIGLAFQVVDDVLDVETDSATLGKTAGKDAMNHKPTVVTALGLTEAKALARRLRDDADRALDALGGNVERLRDLADFITGRSF